MSNFYVDHFFSDDGGIRTLIDTIGNNTSISNEEKWNLDWQRMHQVNDDFGGIALVAAYAVFKQERYLDRLKAMFDWLVKSEHPEGGFFRPEIEVGTACVLIFLDTFVPIAGDRKDEAVSFKSRLLDHLVTLQYQSDNPALHGAFYGMSDNHSVGNREWVNLRNTAYSIFALLSETGKSAFPIPHTGYFAGGASEL